MWVARQSEYARHISKEAASSRVEHTDLRGLERHEIGIKIHLHEGGFPGGPGVENLPCNGGDTGVIPGPGRSHIFQSS